MKKICFIVNPISGIGKPKKTEWLVSKLLDTSVFDFEIIYTNARGHATELAKDAAIRNYDIVVAVGGDGSVNEVAKGLTGTNTAMAIIPAGSGNGFARHIRIPINIEKAILLLNNYTIQTVDTWKLNEYFFLNIAGIGFDGHIAHLFENYGKRGLLSYAKLIFNEFKKYAGSEYSLEIDGEKITERNVFLMSISNASQYGNNAYVNKKSSIQDGIAEVCVLKKFPLIASPLIALKMFTNSLSASKYATNYSGKNITIVKSLIKSHIDGDAIETPSKIRISCNPKSLKIVLPENTNL